MNYDDDHDRRDYDDEPRGPERDHLGRTPRNPKFGCTGGYCRTGRCESPCDPDPADREEERPDPTDEDPDAETPWDLRPPTDRHAV